MKEVKKKRKIRHLMTKKNKKNSAEKRSFFYELVFFLISGTPAFLVII